MKRRVRALRMLLLLVASAGVLVAGIGGVELWQATAANRRIEKLATGHDVPVAADEATVLRVARARYLLDHGNSDAAQVIAGQLAAEAPPPLRASLLYALGNAHMRHALDLFTQVPFRIVSPIIAVAKSEYRQAIMLDPGNWDARYNYALAAALVRDTEASQPTAGDQMSHERAAWPDIPGAPNGLP